jgi:hypothetical protein
MKAKGRFQFHLIVETNVQNKLGHLFCSQIACDCNAIYLGLIIVHSLCSSALSCPSYVSLDNCNDVYNY